MVHSFKVTKDYRLFHRRIMLFFMVLYSFFLFSYISSGISSDLVVDIPAQYLKTLEDVLESNRTPAMVGGLGLVEDFEQSQGENQEVKKLLFKKVTEMKTIFSAGSSPNIYLDVAMKIINDRMVVMFDMEVASNGVKNLICMSIENGQEVPKVKMSKPFASVIAGSFFSPTIDHEVRRRLSTAYHYLLQYGYTKRSKHATRSEGIICRIFMDLTIERERERDSNQLSLSTFYPILSCIGCGLIGCVLVFSGEWFTANILRYFQSSQSIDKRRRTRLCSKHMYPKLY